ncbi:MAG: ATP-binding protein [Desulfobulbaceae bacterium]|nr:ATP-binding protein [Desulfobulbaceae bacterium]
MAKLSGIFDKGQSYHGTITLIFVVLAAILEGFLGGYWIFVLAPRLQSENRAYSHALSEAQAQSLAHIISEKEDPFRKELLGIAIDNILLFRLPQSDKPFTKKIRLELDYESLKTSKRDLDIVRGEEQPDNTMAIEIPLFNAMSNELIGIAHFSNNLEIFQDLKDQIRTKLAMGSGLIMVILTGVWFAVSRLNLKLQTFTYELAREREMSQKMQDSLMDSRILLDTTGTITEINPYTLHLFGYLEEDMIGKHISEFMEQDMLFSGPHLVEFISRTILTNTELNFYHKKGHLIPLMFSGNMVNDPEGNFAGIICIGKDMTPLKAAEKEIREKQAQMAHAGRLSALGEMATGMAHEINQPLYIIRLAADSIADYFSLNDSEAIEANDVKTIIRQVHRADTIITNMRSFARIDTGYLAPTNIHIPTEQALSFFREQFRHNGIMFHEEFALNLPQVIADAQKFEQIIINFLANARHAVIEKRDSISEFQPAITMRLYQDSINQQIIFEVEDNGIGMSKNEVDRCFEPFFTTKEVGQGTGLGLSIVHGLAQEMDMKLFISSTKGTGTIFRILMDSVKTAAESS